MPVDSAILNSRVVCPYCGDNRKWGRTAHLCPPLNRYIVYADCLYSHVKWQPDHIGKWLWGDGNDKTMPVAADKPTPIATEEQRQMWDMSWK